MVIKGIEEGILLLLSMNKNILFFIMDPVDILEYGEGENGLFFLRLCGNALMEFVLVLFSFCLFFICIPGSGDICLEYGKFMKGKNNIFLCLLNNNNIIIITHDQRNSEKIFIIIKGLSYIEFMCENCTKDNYLIVPKIMKIKGLIVQFSLREKMNY